MNSSVKTITQSPLEFIYSKSLILERKNLCAKQLVLIIKWLVRFLAFSSTFAFYFIVTSEKDTYPFILNQLCAVESTVVYTQIYAAPYSIKKMVLSEEVCNMI